MASDESKAKQLERMRQWRIKNKEKLAADKREWRERNAQRLREYDKNYRAGNDVYRAKKLESDRKYYHDVVKKNPDALIKMNAYSKQWAIDNPEKYAAKKRRDVEAVKKIRQSGADNKINTNQRERYNRLPEGERKAIATARREYQKQYRLANAEKLSEDARRHWESNRDAYAVYRKAHYEKNRDAYIAAAEDRHRKLSERGKYTPEDVQNLYRSQSGKCAGCALPIENTRSRTVKRAFEVDHIMPVALGGSNLPENLQLLCRPCNRRKHAKHPDDWAASIGKLFV